ncbi:hypothetical protein B0E47_11900 [Rhodanobacter sp. B05]|uniref:Csu type fimbrial protein n=1 Tax=Rhodanobacter sp. B05 TaxID=1945859 RepID=UPI0009852A63|nr:spore coat U domain-containing protein [Rhodanobacter sp. B05]OOG53895.1 hypothetical protein B0E47_11900 [Rhodanobacter sp. B05]
MTVFRLPFLLLLLLAGALLMPGTARAQVSCTATHPTLNFGTIKVSTTSGASDNGSIGYRCQNTAAATVAFTLCVAIGTPSAPGTPNQPVLLGPSASTLDFNLSADPLSSDTWDATHPLSVPLSVAARATLTGTIPYYGHIPGNQISAVAGTYRSNFRPTKLGYLAGSSCGAEPGYRFTSFTLSVQAQLGNACVVSAGPNLIFGSAGGVAAGTPTVSGSDNIAVTCPNKTPYNVGLLPSDGDTSGMGIMKGTSGGTDIVQYQLYQDPALSTAWGSTATRTVTGNGVHGTGNGNAQPLTVYAQTTSSTDVTPDRYADTVQINVNY